MAQRGPLYPRERPGTHCIAGWVGPRAGLDGCGKFPLPPRFDPRTVQPLASHYTEWAVPAHTQLEYPPSIFLHLSVTLSRVCGGSRSSRAVGSCTAGVTCYSSSSSSSTSHWYSATGCWHRTVSSLNCDVISAANGLTAATRTARAADHVTLRHWEESYWRFETPRCVFLQGESFLDHPETSDNCRLTQPHILSDNYHWSLPS